MKRRKINLGIKDRKQIDEDLNQQTLTVIKSNNYFEIGEYDKALEIIEKIMLELDAEQHIYRIKCFEYMYKIFCKKNDSKKAEETLLNAIRYLENLDYGKQLGDFYVLTGKFYIEIGEKELALNYINKGLDIYKNLGIILNMQV